MKVFYFFILFIFVILDHDFYYTTKYKILPNPSFTKGGEFKGVDFRSLQFITECGIIVHMNKFFVSFIGVVTFVTTVNAQYNNSTPYIDRVVSQKSESHSSSEWEVKPDNRPYNMRSFPMGFSKIPNTTSSSSYTIDTGTYQASSYKSRSVTSTPTYDYTTGQPTITTTKNSSSSHFEQKSEQVSLDYYGRPMSSVSSVPYKQKKFMFGWFSKKKK